MTTERKANRTRGYLVNMAFNGNIHEAEYVPIPARVRLPINSTSESSVSTPARIPTPVKSPNLTVASLSRDNSTNAPVNRFPNLIHKWSHTHSILCVVPSPRRNLIFCGTQNSKILVFDIVNYSLKYEIKCGNSDHSASILCLTIDESEDYLFSAGSDSLIKVWDLSMVNDNTNYPIHCTHIIYLLVDIGDVFSICWSDALSTLFIGAQNASILWCKLCLYSSTISDSQSTIDRMPHFRYDKFFDSKGPGGSINNLQSKHQILKSTSLETSNSISPKLIEVNNDDIIRFAHNGYVYCMNYFDVEDTSNDFTKNYPTQFANLLITGGGDGLVIIWGVSCTNKKVSLQKLKILKNNESVLSMSIQDSYLYVGLSEPCINVWDLMTFQLIRSIHFSNSQQVKNNYDEVLSLGIYNDCIFKASNLGGLVKFSSKTNPPSMVPSDHGNLNPDRSSMVVITEEDDNYNAEFNKSSVENGSVLAVKIFTSTTGVTYLVSGGHKALCLWDITNLGSTNRHLSDANSLSSNLVDNENLLKSLKRFISYKTILKFPALYLEDSRRCSQFLTNLLVNLGATVTKLLPVPNSNPVVYSCFSSNSPDRPKQAKRILWYGHYDVVDATADSNSWSTDPFCLTARDGNLYARGVSDNKGPILAAIYAVSELFHNKELSCDVVFIIEGEEECGSIGFQDVIHENKELIGDIDWIMLSNSYWLDDETPCLNYGLRGVINASITINSDKPDRHSGVDGGVLKEPTMDLIQILGQLMNPFNNNIKIPNFYDDVLSLTDREIEIYQKIENTASTKNIKNQDFKSLMAKWRNPSLTIHNIQVSGPNNNTVIPQLAKASVSIRIVPNQDLEKIKKLLIKTLNDSFNKLETDNHLLINIFHEAEPWLGDPYNLVYKILYDKIRSNWGPEVPEPLFIREGGTIPSIRFLEKCFNACAAQIPCGQASDNAHLKDEKLRILNLFKLRDILADTLKELGSK